MASLTAKGGTLTFVGGTGGPQTGVVASEFVTRDPDTGYLMLNGQRYRFAGNNCGSTSFNMTENANSSNSTYGSPITSSCAAPSNAQLEAHIQSAVDMNATVIRTFSFLMIDHPLALATDLGVYNEDSFERIDYALNLCRDAGIRVIAPLVDNYNFFMGGRGDWCTWSGVSNTAANFYTNATVIANFKAHITEVLNHVNVYTAVAYKDSPEILMWETGNELDVGSGAWENDYSAWTVNIAQHIKTTVGAQQLVADGKNGIYGEDGNPDLTSLESPYVDCFSSHPYRDVNGPEYYMEQADIAASYGKTYFIGESTWTDSSTSGVNEWKLPEMLSQTLGTEKCGGYLFWELHPPGVNHGDGFALHYPGDDADMACRVKQLSDHADLMRDGFIAPITIETAVGASVTSANRTVTFSSNYTPQAGHYVIIFGSSISVRSSGALNAAWTNLLGAGVVAASDAHTLAVAGRPITVAEAAAETRTYSAAGMFDSSTSGGAVGVVLAGVDLTNPIDAIEVLINSTAAVSPHALAGLDGADLSDNCQVLSCIAKDTSNDYEAPLTYGFLTAATANQALWLMSANLPTSAGVDVPQTDIEVDTSGDEYISITLAVRPG